MPETITLGHLLMLLGLVALLYALWQASIFLKHASAGRGTPQYARRRDGRRYAVWGLLAALLLFALGCLTPLGEMAIA
ncbi:MAG TPA: hypothetical protein VD846_02050 [Allosphingosinicella sp.]|nr:hypothetical protein [Allosphingosinicella sp.]